MAYESGDERMHIFIKEIESKSSIIFDRELQLALLGVKIQQLAAILIYA